MNIRYAFGLFATAALLAIGHWLPWPHKLSTSRAYILRLAAVVVGLLIWLGPTRQFLLIIAFVIMAAIVSGSAAFYDWLLNVRQRADLFQLEELDERRRA